MLAELKTPAEGRRGAESGNPRVLGVEGRTPIATGAAYHHFISPLATLALMSSDAAAPASGYCAFIAAISAAPSAALAVCWSKARI
ncbi:hypothetical protein D3C71_1730180 [compost metagenome]